MSRDQLSRWADSLIAGESARTDPELGFMALHALDALAQVTTGIQWPDVVPPEDAVETIANLDWQNPTESAGFTRYLLLALIHRAEDHQDPAAAKEVRRVLKWLAEGLPDSYYLVPDRSGDAFQALAASSCLEPFFVYTFKPTHRVTIRVDAILALLPRHQQLSGSNEVRCLALLDLLAGLKLSESVQRDDVDRALTLGRDLLTFALADESDLIRAWTNCAVLGRIEQALSGGGVPTGSRRWPSPGFRWSAQTLTGNSRQPAATWLVPAGLEIPASPRPRVTVVIPCHNLGRYLPEAIESVCQQTFRDITIAVVDDGSSDTLTKAAIELLQARGIRVIAQENRGLAAARNRGAAEATTEYVCCLDADDRLRPAYLERTVAVLDREPDVAFAGTGTQLFGESDLVLAGAEPRLPHMLAFNQATCVCVFRRTLWQSVGGFHTSLAVPGVEISDWDFWLSLLERGHRGVVLPELLFEYRIRTGSMSYEMYSTGRWPALITELVRRHETLFRDNVEHVLADVHAKWIEQREWLAERERAIQWWRVQAAHFEDAAERARGIVDKATSPSPPESLRVQEQPAIPSLQSLVSNQTSLLEAFANGPQSRTVLDAYRRAPTERRLVGEHNARNQQPDPLTVFADTAGGDGRLARVCIATPDIVGPIRNGGIGSAYQALALLLKRAGHDVTILYTRGAHSETGTIDEWVRQYRRQGIELVALPALPLPVDGPEEWGLSYAAYVWLRQGEFDIIHFPEMFGTGACAVESKRLGLAFANATLCVGLHSPTIWNRLENQQTVRTVEDLFLDALERKAVECADVLISPSQYLLNWIDHAGWKRPSRTYVHPNAIESPPASRRAATSLDELVFFGRLETRKGLQLFCDAVDLLATESGSMPRQVTFLGKSGTAAGMDGDAYVRHRSSAWPFAVVIHSDWSRDRALEYLTTNAALAVMPSLSDNTPNTVVECLSCGVPFVATSVGGIPEMIRTADHGRVLAPPAPQPLAAAIRAALAQEHRRADAAADSTEINRRWLEWHASLPRAASTVDPKAPRTPLVSVCIATRNRPALLEEALDSVDRQTYRNLEIIVVDDGSDDSATQQLLDGWRAAHAGVRMHTVCGPQRFPGAARNAAASHAHGEYLLFMDDDNIALPTEVATLVAAAVHATLDVVTCGFQAFQHLPRQERVRLPQFVWLPVGAAMPLGLLLNCFGDTNMLIRRDAFFIVGGFDEEQGAGLVEDWVFHSRAFLLGLRAAAVPEPLFEYRRWPGATGQNGDAYLSYVRALRPYIEQLDPAFAQILLYASGMFRETGDSAVSPSPDAQARFARADRVATLCRDQLRLEHQLSWLDSESEIAILSHGTDPQMHLPRFRTFTGRSLLLRIEITPPRPTTLQVFWIANDGPAFYTEERSAMVPLPARRSTVIVEVPAAAVASPIRLDPGFVQGIYAIHGIEVRQDVAAPIGGALVSQISGRRRIAESLISSAARLFRRLRRIRL